MIYIPAEVAAAAECAQENLRRDYCLKMQRVAEDYELHMTRLRESFEADLERLANGTILQPATQNAKNAR